MRPPRRLRRLAAIAVLVGGLGTSCVGQPGRNDEEFERRQRREADEREQPRRARIGERDTSTVGPTMMTRSGAQE